MDNNNENNNFNGESKKFGLPDGYFQKSANTIFNKIEWLEEHKAFTFLSTLKKETGFVTPKNYFNTIDPKLELLNYPTLSSINKVRGFKTPVNYFEEVEALHFINLTLNEHNELEAFNNLNLLTKKTGFKVEDNYFTTLEEKLKTTLLKEDKPTRIIKLFSPKLYYAAAAILTITLGMWIYSNYFKIADIKDCGTLACVDKVDLVKTKNLENLDSDQLYELVDTKKLEEKLEGKSENKTDKNKTKKDDKNDLDSSLKNVSTQELLDEI